MTAVYR